jgi:hypothetical protein
MNRTDSVERAARFWREVWMAPQNPGAIDELVAEDFCITSGGNEIHGREAFKAWVIDFQRKIANLEFEVLESFQSPNGDRVATRWRVTGRNNGMLGTAPNLEPIVLTGISILAIGEDGRLQHNWVERNAWELSRRLANA